MTALAIIGGALVCVLIGAFIMWLFLSIIVAGGAFDE